MGASTRLLLLTLVAVLLGSCGGVGVTPVVPASPAAATPLAAPAFCPTTRGPEPAFVPPAGFPRTAPAGYDWYGTPALWTAVTSNGTWQGLHYNGAAYVQKVFWWRDGYDFRTEPIPHLTVSGTSVDGFAKPLVASTATNAQAPELGSAMLVGVDIPSTGCWKITGRYNESELSFVVWVGA